MTIEYCRKNSESHKGLQGGNKNGMFGKHRTNEEKQHLRELHNTKIYQFDLNGNYITEYESIKSAATAVGCKSPSKLSDCARGKSKSAYKFK